MPFVPIHEAKALAHKRRTSRPARIEGGAMTYTAVKPLCENCPHNGEALIGEAQAQYLEHVIEDGDRELGSLRVCATCQRFYSQFDGTGVNLPECLGLGPGQGLERCRFSPSRWSPYWLGREK
jgi:hypothetical protein